MTEVVSEERLVSLEARWVNSSHLGWADATLKSLVGEVRASRAREAELAEEVETWKGRCSLDQDNMTKYRRQAIAAEAERDGLRQRIDKALALLDVTEHDPVRLACDRNFDGSLSPAHIRTDAVRAALAGLVPVDE